MLTVIIIISVILFIITAISLIEFIYTSDVILIYYNRAIIVLHSIMLVFQCIVAIAFMILSYIGLLAKAGNIIGIIGMALYMIFTCIYIHNTHHKLSIISISCCYILSLITFVFTVA